MPSVGPDLPPHLLAKRKWEDEEAAPASKSPRAQPPTPPETLEKRRRIIGPAPPPAPLDELPNITAHEEDDSSSSDDDFGPAVPIGDAAKASYNTVNDSTEPENENAKAATEASSQRQAWMLKPPSQSELSARMDPTKLRARGFNKGGSSVGDGHNLWDETPEQKRKRLENEILGISTPSTTTTKGTTKARSKADEETARKIKEYNEKNRVKSLYDQHKEANSQAEEDDPSKRAFDYEKDIAGGVKIGHAQRKDMLNRARDFSSRFSGGGYL